MKTLSNPCYHFRSYKDGSHGECCCNCEYQRPIQSHPWNKSDFAKGPSSRQIAYGCCHPEFFPHITMFEEKHGMCEVWQENKWRAKMAAAEDARAKEAAWAILKEPIKDKI